MGYRHTHQLVLGVLVVNLTLLQGTPESHAERDPGLNYCCGLNHQALSSQLIKPLVGGHHPSTMVALCFTDEEKGTNK